MYFQGQWGTYRSLYISRLERDSRSKTKPIYACASQVGDPSTLKWFECQTDSSSIDVVYSALNFPDVLLSPGHLRDNARREKEHFLGMEFSGIHGVTKTRIMGVAQQSAIASNVITSPLNWKIPKSWTMEEAVTVPLAYITVYYAFFHRIMIKKGQTIFIKLDSCGIGLAAIRVALAYGLEVFTICHNEESRILLLNTFPELKESHVANSREISCEDMIVSETNSKGVDLMLNSLSGGKIQNCIAVGGTFLETGSVDNVLKQKLDTNVSITCVMANLLLRNLSDPILQKIKDTITIDIQQEIIKPLPFTVFSAKNILEGIRFLENETHFEKVLIKIRDKSNNYEVLPVVVSPKVYFSSEMAYIIITTNFEVFDVEVVNFMVLRGARQFFFHSRKALGSSFLEYRKS